MRNPRRLAIALLVLLFVRTGFSIWFGPDEVPVARLLANLRAYTEENPDDPEGHYLLGRVHGLAFVHRSRYLGAYERWAKPASLPEIATDHHQRSLQRTTRDPHFQADGLKFALYKDELDFERPDPEMMRTHLTLAIAELERALDRKSDHAFAHLGLAYVFEEGAPWADRVDHARVLGLEARQLDLEHRHRIEGWIEALSGQGEEAAQAYRELSQDVPSALAQLEAGREDDSERRRAACVALLRTLWTERAMRHYERAFALTFEADSKLEMRPPEPINGGGGLRDLVSYEAANAMLRLLDRRPETPAVVGRKQELAKAVSRLNELPRSRFVTPIVFRLSPSSVPSDLLAPGACALFDLDGDGLEEAWPWVAPDTGSWFGIRTGSVRSAPGVSSSVPSPGGCSSPTATARWTPSTTTATASCAERNSRDSPRGSTATAMVFPMRARSCRSDPSA